MRFGGDRGGDSFGQGSEVPGSLQKGGMRPRGIPARNAPMQGGLGIGARPVNYSGGGFPPGAGMMPMGVSPTGMLPAGIPPSGISPTGMLPAGMPLSGVSPTGMLPARKPPSGMMPTGISPGGMPPSGMQNFGGMRQPPMQPSGPTPGTMPGPAQGGTIRNNLGAALKKRGFFQKDGKINNSRGGFFGAKPQKQGFPQGGEASSLGTIGGIPGAQSINNTGGGSMGTGPFSFLGNGGGLGGQGMPQARQLILEAAQAGVAANGIATISPDNVFTCIANLPSPNTLVGQGHGTYAAYLVDQKGQTGFLAGVLRPVGNGAYQTQFRSQVPLAHYSRVMITVENAQQLGHVPRGPVILQVKQPMGSVRFITPVKNAGGSVWKKISGLFQRKPKAPVLPEGGGVPIEGGLPTRMEIPGGNPPIDPIN